MSNLLLHFYYNFQFQCDVRLAVIEIKSCLSSFTSTILQSRWISASFPAKSAFSWALTHILESFNLRTKNIFRRFWCRNCRMSYVFQACTTHSRSSFLQSWLPSLTTLRYARISSQVRCPKVLSPPMPSSCKKILRFFKLSSGLLMGLPNTTQGPFWGL